MSSKIGLILSMIFVSLFFAFGIDLIMVQVIYSDLDAKSVSISYKISQYGTIDDKLKEAIENDYEVTFVCLGNCEPKFGDTVTFAIAKNYNPIIIKDEPMTISVKRNAVIGYYN